MTLSSATNSIISSSRWWASGPSCAVMLIAGKETFDKSVDDFGDPVVGIPGWDPKDYPLPLKAWGRLQTILCSPSPSGGRWTRASCLLPCCR